jgi:hypothetical protein
MGDCRESALPVAVFGELLLPVLDRSGCLLLLLSLVFIALLI